MRSVTSRVIDAIGKFIVLAAVLLASGCAIFQGAVEVPSLENQLNRVVTGLDAVRTNEVIAAMPISADAKWPAQLDEDMSEENKTIIDAVLEHEPYVGTHVYTDGTQMQVLGGYYMPKVGDLVYSVVNKLLILYGLGPDNSTDSWPAHWPSAFELDSNISSYNEFTNKGTTSRVEAIRGNVYEGYANAVISLMPTNFQKDLETAKAEMDEAMSGVVDLKGKVGELEARIDKAEEGGTPLSDTELTSINDQIDTFEADLEQQEAIYDEREEIYLTKLDAAVEELKSDINLSEEQVALAKNIDLAASAIYSGAADAGIAFGVALTNLTGLNPMIKDVIGNFPNELASLTRARQHVPPNKQNLFDKRYERLAEYGMYALPALAVGSYYAIKQVLLAGTYSDIAEVILDADEARKEALLEAEEEAREAEQEAAQG